MKQKYWSKNSQKKSIQIHTGLFDFIFLGYIRCLLGEAEACDIALVWAIQAYVEESVICVVKFTLCSL